MSGSSTAAALENRPSSQSTNHPIDYPFGRRRSGFPSRYWRAMKNLYKLTMGAVFVSLIVIATFAWTAAAEPATKPCTVEPCPTAVPATWKGNRWRSQKGYYYCIYNGRTVRCMTTVGEDPSDPGYTLVIGKRRAWQGQWDSVPCPACGTLNWPDKRMRILRWGSYKDFGRYRCTARRIGMICVNRLNGHGFGLSVTHYSDMW